MLLSRRSFAKSMIAGLLIGFIDVEKLIKSVTPNFGPIIQTVSDDFGPIETWHDDNGYITVYAARDYKMPSGRVIKSGTIVQTFRGHN